MVGDGGGWWVLGAGCWGGQASSGVWGSVLVGTWGCFVVMYACVHVWTLV